MTISRFSVVQYVPDTLRDERINVGVIAFDDSTVLVHYLSNWERVTRFAGHDVSFLKPYLVGLAANAESGFVRGADIELMSRKLINTIHVTAPRASILPVDNLLRQMASMMLVEEL